MKKALAVALTMILAVSIAAAAFAETDLFVRLGEKQPIGKSEFTGLDIYEINDKKPVEIRFLNVDAPGLSMWEIYTRAAEEFMKDYPNVTVNIDGLGSSATWRQNAVVEFSGSDAPAVSWAVPSYAASFINDGLIYDFADIYPVERYAYFSEFLSEATRNNMADSEGRLAFMPYVGQIGHVVYNKAIFEEHGWSVPTTFEELLTLCDEMNANGVIPFGMAGADFRYAWILSEMMLRGCGLEQLKALATTDYDQWANEETGFPEVMRKLGQLIEHKAFHPGSNGIGANVDQPGMFARGEFAMLYEGVWKIAAAVDAGGVEWANENVGIFAFPSMPDMPNGDAQAIIGGTTEGFVLSTLADEVQTEAALEFIKYIVCQKNMKSLIEGGRSIPAGRVEYDTGVVPNAMRQAYENYLAAPRGIAPLDGLCADPEIDMQLKKEIVPMLIAGEISVEEAIARTDEVAKSCMK